MLTGLFMAAGLTALVVAIAFHGTLWLAIIIAIESAALWFYLGAVSASCGAGPVSPDRRLAPADC